MLSLGKEYWGEWVGHCARGDHGWSSLMGEMVFEAHLGLARDRFNSVIERAHTFVRKF